jgi:hypothetical protein
MLQVVPSFRFDRCTIFSLTPKMSSRTPVLMHTPGLKTTVMKHQPTVEAVSTFNISDITVKRYNNLCIHVSIIYCELYLVETTVD